MIFRKIIAALTACTITLTSIGVNVTAEMNEDSTWYGFSGLEKSRLKQSETTITIEYVGENEGWRDVGVGGYYNDEWVSYYFPCELGVNTLSFTVAELLDKISDEYNGRENEGSDNGGEESEPKPDIQFAPGDIDLSGVSAANGSSLLSVSVERSAEDQLYSEYPFSEEQVNALKNENAQLVVDCDNTLNTNFFQITFFGKYNGYTLQATYSSDAIDGKVYIGVDDIAIVMSKYYNEYINEDIFDTNISAEDIQMISVMGLDNTVILSTSITVRNQVECYDPTAYIDNIEGYLDIAENWGADEAVTAKDYIWEAGIWNGAALTCPDGTITSENASDYMIIVKAEIDDVPSIRWDESYNMWRVILGRNTWYFYEKDDCTMMVVVGPTTGNGAVNQMNIFDASLENGKTTYTYAFNAADINFKLDSDFYSQLQMAYAEKIKLTIGYAEICENNDYIYRNNGDGTITITKYKGNEENVVIPAEINGKKVIGIGADSFSNSDSLKSVEIPNGVTKIEERAFENCTSLTSVVIPLSVESIESGAFMGCAFTSIEIPNSVVSIGNEAFANCVNMTAFGIPESVEYIGEYVFYNDTSLTDINVAENNKNFSSTDGVLFNKDHTELIKYPDGKKDGSYLIPDSVTSIRDNALDSTNLTAINVDDKNEVYSSYNGVLLNKEQTVLIKYPRGKSGDYIIPDSVKSVGSSSFEECNLLTSVEIPSNVTNIGVSAFNNCNSLTHIEIPDSITSIIYSAFASCSSLTSAVIPTCVKEIKNTSFLNCPNLTIYGYTGSYAEVYSTERNIPFVSIDDSAKIQINKGIVVSVPEDSEATLQEKHLEVKKIKDDSVSVTYSISLKDNNGNAVQPEGKVTVTIPVPKNLNNEQCKVYYREKNGTNTVIEAVYERGCFVFTTDNLGTYIISTEEPPKFKLGDLDKNDTVNIVDALTALKAATGKLQLSEEQEFLADVNSDGKVNVVDALTILKAATGKVEL